MSLTSVLSQPCEVILRDDTGDTDDDGNVDYGQATFETVCSLQQTQRDEPAGEGEFSVSTWTIFLPTGTNVSTATAVVVDGLKYEFVGVPWDAKLGSPEMWHMEGTVKRTAGAGDVG